MIIKQTTVTPIEITCNGTIQIRLALELVEDGSVLNYKWHRTAIIPGGDIAAQMTAVNDHLMQMNESIVSDAEIAKISAQAAVAWTPEIIAAYEAQHALLAEQTPAL